MILDPDQWFMWFMLSVVVVGGVVGVLAAIVDIMGNAVDLLKEKRKAAEAKRHGDKPRKNKHKESDDDIPTVEAAE